VSGQIRKGTPIGRVLVANRGEIALRVFRSCRALGLGTVAVAEPDDLGSLHARSAESAVEISSYLDASEHVRAARETGADAVHPGYGFLAESAELADAVEAAGLTWIGPPPSALRQGGDKLEAKEIARGAGVPVVESGDAAEIGFPLLVKAAAGGGGRGMRVVRSQGELEAALEAARREALAAFGDDTVFCERWVERARHVEVQLLADAHGTVRALGERECSVQRRHQKVLEESPSPGIGECVRRGLFEAGESFARAIGYRSAGTAEFLVAEDGPFYFLELNARIQVEHPVTEAVTGRDLVADQIRIAEGHTLEPGDGVRGHAIEVRLYAEDPLTFLPQAGKVERLRLPSNIRVDAGVEEGDRIGTRYDPLIAKLIASGSNRDEAIDRLRDALAETDVGGLVTNLPFLRWLVAHPAFRAGDTTTDFLTRFPPLTPAPVRAAPALWRRPFRLNLPTPAVEPPPLDEPEHGHSPGEANDEVTAPMPGTVIRVLVEAGQEVEARDTLVVVEAMKMEMPLPAPRAGIVRAVHVTEGETVGRGEVLVELEEGA
jgi:acetyl/propionyl-CoA carboxylase alpha subunit